MGGASDRRNILLLGSNDRGCLATCRALGLAGHRVSILRLARQRTPAEHSKFCTQSLYLGTQASGVRAYLSRLADLLRNSGYDYLIPIDDLACELIFSDYHSISALTRVVGPHPAAYGVARDHMQALAMAGSIGLAQPPTRLLRLGEAPAFPLVPCVVRPLASCTIIDDEPQSFTIRKVNTVDELDAKLRDDLSRTDVLLQVPASGTPLSLNGCAVNGELLGASAISGIHGSAWGGIGTYRRMAEITPHLLAIIQGFVHRLSWTGFLSIICTEEHGRLTFTNLACRPTGAVAPSLLGGVDFPGLVLKGLEGHRPAGIVLPIRTVYMRDLRRDVGWLIREATKSGGVRAAARWSASFARALIGQEGWDIEQLSDPLPALRQFDRTLASFRERLAWRLSPIIRPRGTAIPAMLSKSSSLLVVCQGNINRSVVAENLLRAKGFTRVYSAGLLPMTGRRASIQAERFLAQRLGISIAAFRSKTVERALKTMGDVELIVCFERRHLAELVRRFPDLNGRICLLAELAGYGRKGTEIADPHGADPETYLACFRQIDDLVVRLGASTQGHTATPIS
jgi:protein-tyrosine-phosphatase